MDAGRHPNIKLMAFSEVENVSGYVGNFKVTVRKKARYVDASVCNSCGDCADVCPVKINLPELLVRLRARAMTGREPATRRPA